MAPFTREKKQQDPSHDYNCQRCDSAGGDRIQRVNMGIAGKREAATHIATCAVFELNAQSNSIKGNYDFRRETDTNDETTNFGATTQAGHGCCMGQSRLVSRPAS